MTAASASARSAAPTGTSSGLAPPAHRTLRSAAPTGTWSGLPRPAHRTPEELAAFVPELLHAPRDVGELALVVRRPAPGEREVLDEGELDLALGLVGDTWAQRGTSRMPDGGPHPDMQLTVMSARMVAFLAGDPARRPLAGDQLYVDLDLSRDNLPAGTRLTIGEPSARGAVIEVTAEPHTGCAKFVERFGAEAMRFVNGPLGRPMRLRGLNARVVEPGWVRPGDRVRVTR
jgi:MOSC domain-containing protein YiiM